MMMTTNLPFITVPMELKNFQLDIIDEPNEIDVLCGSRSKTLSRHPGNKIFMQRIESCLEQYEKATTKQERITINRGVIQFMRLKYGARFLKQNPDGKWTKADNASVRDKVSHAFRFASNKKNKAGLKKKKVPVETSATTSLMEGHFEEDDTTAVSDSHSVSFSENSEDDAEILNLWGMTFVAV